MHADFANTQALALIKHALFLNWLFMWDISHLLEKPFLTDYKANTVLPGHMAHLN